MKFQHVLVSPGFAVLERRVSLPTESQVPSESKQRETERPSSQEKPEPGDQPWGPFPSTARTAGVQMGAAHTSFRVWGRAADSSGGRIASSVK